MNIAILSPFNPIAVADFLNGDSKKRVYDNECASSSVNAIVRGLIKLGHHVWIITSDYHSSFKTLHFTGDNIDLFVVSRKIIIPKTGIFERTYMQVRLQKVLKQIVHKLDVIHSQWTYEYAAASIPFAHSVLTFCTARDWCPYQHSINRNIYWKISLIVFNKVMDCKDIHFVGNSTYIQQNLQKRSNSEFVPVIPNPVRSEFLLEEERPYPENPVIISIAQSLDERRKNIITLLKAFAAARKIQNNLSLWLVGHCNPSGEIMRTINELEISPSVRLFSSVPHLELCKILKDVSVLVHPAIEETFGNIFLEGMGCKVPVIGGKEAGGVPEVLGYGKYGFLCDVKSVDDLKNTILNVLDDKKTSRTIVSDAYKHLKATYAENVIAKKHEDLYKEYINK